MTIEINNLNKNYNNILAVKDLNFTINKGSIVGLLGPNGCGKTTTIGMMLGLIKPTSGTVFINGQNIENENNRTTILEKVNFISPYVELPKKLTVEENLKVYGKLYGVNNLQDKISDLMKQLNLFEFKKKNTGELSSGQKNRVALAKALIGFGKEFKSRKNHFNLSKSGNLKEAANNLYKTMRKIKKKNFKSIAVVKIPNKKIGYAINDRLKKASNK